MQHQLHSPLFMALDDPVLHEFISYLAQKKAEQQRNPDLHIEIELSRQFIRSVRESFRRHILDGEQHLHILAHLLASILLEGEFELHSNVIGVLPGDDERPFHIRERIKRETLFSVMDIDLGNQMLDNFRYHKDRSWVPLQLSANFVEYIPKGRPQTGVNRLTSRVKAEEEIWNKVTDEIFHVDELISRDKHLRQYSKYVKDIFGVKIICDDDYSCIKVHEQLKKFTSAPNWQQMEKLDEFLPPAMTAQPSPEALEFLETKDYLNCSASEMKQTGWRALKSVVRWHDRLFEIQVQPLGNYYMELDHMAGPSHRSFKLSRDSMRTEIAQRIPLFGFYQNLLRMLFKDSEVSFECENASVVIKD
jgi:ppGpp synthetase/RelA/SpoT-type nucleotidyltranferase